MSRVQTRAAPPPAATNAAYQQIEQWLPMTDRGTDSILVLTTRTPSAQHLQGFFQQSGRRANAETAVKVAGATAKHCIVLHGKANFLSGTSRSTDFDHECHTRANVAYSRATDLTVSACPVNMHGTTGVSQVLSALLHGVCTLSTDDQQTFFLRESRRYVCRFCTSHLSRVKKELLSRLQSNRDNDQPKTKKPKTTHTHTHSQEHQRGSNLLRNSLSHVGRVKKVKQGRRIQHGAQ